MGKARKRRDDDFSCLADHVRAGDDQSRRVDDAACTDGVSAFRTRARGAVAVFSVCLPCGSAAVDNPAGAQVYNGRQDGFNRFHDRGPAELQLSLCCFASIGHPVFLSVMQQKEQNGCETEKNYKKIESEP